jgi:queuosine precursor transporter
VLTWNDFNRSHKVYVWMAAIFVICLVIANLIGAMLFSFRLPFLKDPVLLSAGVIPFPVTFILTDLLNEFYGKKGAQFVTWIGFGMCLLAFVLLSMGGLLPVSPQTLISKSVFMTISTQYTGMFLASITAYLIGQMLDIQIFHLIRSLTKHRFIWLRATGSTVISQLFDTVIVTSIAFGSQMAAHDLFRVILGDYTWKFMIAVGITPLLYLGHILLKKLMPQQEKRLEMAEPEYQG